MPSAYTCNIYVHAIALSMFMPRCNIYTSYILADYHVHVLCPSTGNACYTYHVLIFVRVKLLMHEYIPIYRLHETNISKYFLLYNWNNTCSFTIIVSKRHPVLLFQEGRFVVVLAHARWLRYQEFKISLRKLAHAINRDFFILKN